MALEHEMRMKNVVPVGDLSAGDSVTVRTRMGKEVMSGAVRTVTPFGIIMAESSGGTSFFRSSLYLFASEKAEEEVENPLDSRVQAKLDAMSEAGDPTASDAGGAKTMSSSMSKKDKEDEEGKEGKEDDKEGGEKSDKEPEDDKKDKKDKDSGDSDSVDPEDLPSDIKSSISSAGEFSDAEANEVLSDINDVAIKTLKRNGILEKDVLRVAQAISDAVDKVLAGEKSKE